MLNGIHPVAPHAMHYYDSWRIKKDLTIGSSDRGVAASVSQGGGEDGDKSASICVGATSSLDA
jgi:hypothetical protein